MDNEYFRRGILGFCIGITVSIVISLLVSLVAGDGSFHYVSAKLLSYIDNEIIAATFQVLLSGILGMAVSISLLCFKVEKWSLLQQVCIHFVIMSVLMIGIFLLSSLSFIEYIVILVLLYFIMWNVQYLFYRHKVKEINDVLKKINGDDTISESRVDKNIIILLIAYGILIITFILYDFLQIKLPIIPKFLVLLVTCIIMLIYSVKLIRSKKGGSSISKAIVPVVSISLLLLVLGINCSDFVKTCGEYTVKSTELNEVYIDGLTVNDSFEKFNKMKYTPTDRYSNDDYNFIYEELMISEKNNEINNIFGRVEKVDITVNGHEHITNLDEVVSILGNNYVKATYDDEQLLKQYIYIDKENDIKVSFIYREFDSNEDNNKIEYVVISKTNS